MASDRQPITIKKYANRRLYNTGTSVYVTLEDLATMVKKGEDFVVFDAKSGEDLTRSVLTQIIFEQESKGTQALMPITFLRQLIRFYGDSMQMLVPSYLEFTIDRLTSDQEKFRNQFAEGLNPPAGPETADAENPDLAVSAPGNPARQIFAPLEEQTRKNMAMFTQALSMFNPFTAAMKPPGIPGMPGVPAPQPEEPHPEAGPKPKEAPKPESKNDIDEIKRQLSELQKRLEGLSSKE